MLCEAFRKDKTPKQLCGCRFLNRILNEAENIEMKTLKKKRSFKKRLILIRSISSRGH